MTVPPNVYRCPVHDGQLHGGEAAELRGALEQLIDDGKVSAGNIRRLLQRIDARDSLAHEERAGRTAELLAACASIPDITLSRWACDPGHHWRPVRDALRAFRAAQGLTVDAEDPVNAFDERGWLRARGAP